jgi:hypothetical protein
MSETNQLSIIMTESQQIGLFLVCISAAIILSFPSVNFLMYLSLSIDHRIATPPLPLGTWKFEIGSLQSTEVSRI